MKKSKKQEETIVRSIPIDQIIPNPWNRTQFDPRALKGLAASIRAEGIREPLLVRPIGGGRKGVGEYGSKGVTSTSRDSDTPLPRYSDTTSYQIASGNRRWLAAKKVGLKTVPCLVENLSDEQVAEDNITMNIQREDIPPLELARMVQDYMTRFGKSQAGAARRFGKSRAWASQLLGFLKLPPEALKVFSALNTSWVTLQLIRSLPPDLTIKLAQEAADTPLSPRGVAKRCRQLLFGSHSKGGFTSNPPPPDPLKRDWEQVNDALLQAASPVWWEVEYSRRKMPTGASSLGWFFFAMPQLGAPKEALAEWFTQMGKALRGGKLEDPIPRDDARIKQAEAKVMSALSPRLPRTAEEKRELEQLAVRGTPKDVYEWIYGKGSPMAAAVPFPTWKEAQLSPQEGLKLILEGIGGPKIQ